MRLAERYTRPSSRTRTGLKIYTVTKYESVSNYVQETLQRDLRPRQDGNAYVVDGTVYFDTSTFPDYGKLSHMTPKGALAEAVWSSPKKKHLLDFALWRPVVLVEGSWDSPWGRGRPAGTSRTRLSPSPTSDPSTTSMGAPMS